MSAGIVCNGSMLLGSGCGNCARCRDEVQLLANRCHRLERQNSELRSKLRDAMEWNWLDDDIEEYCDVESFRQLIDAPPAAALSPAIAGHHMEYNLNMVSAGGREGEN